MRNALIPRPVDTWDPFHLVRDLREEMNSVLERSLLAPRGWGQSEALFSPDVDVKDERDHLLVKADIPGIKKEDLSITLDGNILTLKGERKESQEKKGKDYFYSERFFGSFSRSVELPAKARTDGAKATYRDGVLEITLPKDEAAKPKEVKIQIQ